MKLVMQVGLDPGHIALDGDPAPLPQRGTAPSQFSAHICCGQMATWIKMPLGMEVGLGPGVIVLHGDPSPQKREESSPHFSAHVLKPNGWKNQDATWYGGSPRPRPHCAKWGPSSPRAKKGHSPPPILGPCLLWPNGWIDEHATWYGCKPRPRPHCVR